MAITGTPFAPVKRRTISSEIRAQLLEAIRTGELEPGSPVPAERQLCQQFGVARTSVREAIQGLAASGYLERRGNRPVVAERLPEIRLTGSSPTLDERKVLVRQLFEVRRTIEPAMSELAARRATDAERADIAELAVAIDRSARRVPQHRPLVAHRRCHEHVATRCSRRSMARRWAHCSTPASSRLCCTPRSTAAKSATSSLLRPPPIGRSPMRSWLVVARPRSPRWKLTSTMSSGG